MLVLSVNGGQEGLPDHSRQCAHTCASPVQDTAGLRTFEKRHWPYPAEGGPTRRVRCERPGEKPGIRELLLHKRADMAARKVDWGQLEQCRGGEQE